jgi:hypothetical protein
MQKILWQIPLRTADETNPYENVYVKRRRHHQQQYFIRSLFRAEAIKRKGDIGIELPCVVKMIRLSNGVMDEEDNLRMAFKWIKDEIGRCLFPEKSIVYVTKKGQVKENRGRCDDDKRVKWEYGQEKHKTLAIRIEITSCIDDVLSPPSSIEDLCKALPTPRVLQKGFSELLYCSHTKP